ncbi:MAG: hypothetical protein GMKNLPBB_00276 [Myxococcota bacterium]|nr:hypothetical protein [Myxococcota bacterium]
MTIRFRAPLLLIAAMLAGWPPPAHATRYYLHTETTGIIDQIATAGAAFSGDAADVLSRRRAIQTVNLAVDDMTGRDFSLRLESGFRYAAEFGVISLERALLPELQHNEFDLMFLHLKGEEWFGFLGWTLGRQIRTDVLGFHVFDGLTVSGRSAMGFELEAWSGFAAKTGRFGFGLGEPDGVQSNGRVQVTSGAAINYLGGKGIQVRSGWRRVFDGSIVEERGGAGVNLEAAPETLRVYADAVWNFSYRLMDRLLAGARWTPDRQWAATGEVFHHYPLFSADSIFAYFNTQPYDEARARLAWSRGDWHVRGGYALRRFQQRDINEPDLPDQDSFSNEWDHGLLGEVGWRPEHWGGSVGGSGRTGSGGHQRLFTAEGYYWFMDDWFGLEGGVNHYGSSRDGGLSRAISGLGVNLAVHYRPDGWVRFKVLGEQDFNNLTRFRTRVFLVAELFFGEGR